jgi:beta-lactamase superfamily II metal-dependent hydrolase
LEPIVLRFSIRDLFNGFPEIFYRGFTMGFEVDFLAVGDGEKSGDAIAVRYGNLHGSRSEQRVLVIDGGTLEAGEKLVNHIRTYYKTDWVNAVISTHADIDHACGLKVVLEQLDFGALLMHKPWEHANEICELFKNPVTPSKLKEKLQKAITAAHDLQEICTRRNKPVYEPFTGNLGNDGVALILGPNRDYYQQLVAQFRDTPDARFPAPSILQKVGTFAKDAIEWVSETMQIETLDDSGVTSHENNSSVILLLRIDGHKLLFTADAGIPALTAAADYAASQGITLDDLRFAQIPHHGSKHNVGKTILNRIKAGSAFVSAGANAPKHPAKKVMNAFIRRGSRVFVTAGKNLQHFNDSPTRGWEAAIPVEFSPQVEK